MGGVRRVLTGIGRALRARPRLFVGVAAAVVVLDVLVPVAVLSIARGPVDYVTLNPWLGNLPGYLASGKGSLAERLGRAWELALFWFSADGIFGIDWGFAVTTADLARFILTAALVGLYFALWAHRRARSGGPTGWRMRAGGPGGVLGAVGSVCGLATGGCTVMGCGAPVIPVVGLAFAGLSSGTLAFLASLSRVGTLLVFLALVAGVAVLGWQTGERGDPVRAGRGTTARIPS
jgi:hypothetical protein